MPLWNHRQGFSPSCPASPTLRTWLFLAWWLGLGWGGGIGKDCFTQTTQNKATQVGPVCQCGRGSAGLAMQQVASDTPRSSPFYPKLSNCF